MKISKVSADIVGVMATDGTTPRRNWVFVNIETEEGITGIGEATTQWHELAVHEVDRKFDSR